MAGCLPKYSYGKSQTPDPEEGKPIRILYLPQAPILLLLLLLLLLFVADYPCLLSLVSLLVLVLV